MFLLLFSLDGHAPLRSSGEKKKITRDPSAIYDHASYSFLLRSAFPTLPAIHDIKGASTPIKEQSMCSYARWRHESFIIATWYRDKRAVGLETWTAFFEHQRELSSWRAGKPEVIRKPVFVKSNRIRERRNTVTRVLSLFLPPEFIE